MGMFPTEAVVEKTDRERVKVLEARIAELRVERKRAERAEKRAEAAEALVISHEGRIECQHSYLESYRALWNAAVRELCEALRPFVAPDAPQTEAEVEGQFWGTVAISKSQHLAAKDAMGNCSPPEIARGWGTKGPPIRGKCIGCGGTGRHQLDCPDLQSWRRAQQAKEDSSR